MGLSRAFVDAHIARWQEALAPGPHPWRAKWPRLLFHHTPVENAVRILRSERLLSRRQVPCGQFRDVAAPGVIDRSDRAHSFVRLYFRPRTPTQFHIEGIRRDIDCEYPGAHCPVLVMFAFDARQVLTSAGVHFSPVNMQTGTVEETGEAEFSSIPFEKVYRTGSTGGDASIKAHRCAEVLAPSPLRLGETLRHVYCRSDAERVTLLRLLGRAAATWEKRILVSDELQLFEKRFSFVESASLVHDGILFRIHARHDQAPVCVRVEAHDRARKLVVRKERGDVPPSRAVWKVRADFKPGTYDVRIALEGHLACQAMLRIDDAPF